jgi:hypothetical protein
MVYYVPNITSVLVFSPKTERIQNKADKIFVNLTTCDCVSLFLLFFKERREKNLSQK